jgi:hypothetical protein
MQKIPFLILGPHPPMRIESSLAIFCISPTISKSAFAPAGDEATALRGGLDAVLDELGLDESALAVRVQHVKGLPGVLRRHPEARAGQLLSL